MDKQYIKEYKEGDIIFCEFEPGGTFYLIKKGKVKISKISEKHEKTLDIMGEGSIFGEMAIIEQAPRSASAIAETNVVLMEFTKENFKEVLSTNPQLLVNLIRIVCRRIFEAKRRLSVLEIKDNEGKIIDAILMLAENVLRRNPDLAEEEKYISIQAGINDIAHWCGLDETSTRSIMLNMERQEKIETKPGMIIIKDLQDLHRMIERKRKMAKAGLIE